MDWKMFKEIPPPPHETQRTVEKIRIPLEWAFSISIFHAVGFTS